MNSFMNELLDSQRVRKRYSGRTGKSRGRVPLRVNTSGQGRPGRAAEPGLRKFRVKTAFRPAGVSSLFEKNSRIIDRIKQEPVRINRQKYSHARSGQRQNLGGEYFFSFLKPGKIARVFTGEEREDAGSPDSPQEKPRFSFALPAIPVTGLLVLALGIFFVIYSQGGALDWMNREVVKSGKDQGSQYNLALYAGVSPEAVPQDKAQEGGEAIPLDMTETFAWQTYKVKKGDSVSKIAAAFSISMDAVIASNGITNARSLREGEELRIPNMDGIPYTVKSGDSLSGISRAKGVPLEAILDANNLESDKINAGMSLFIPGARMKSEDLKLALGELFMYPLNASRLSSPFGWRDDPFTGVRTYHAAVDLSAPQGTPIKAAMDGKVAAQGYNATYGNYIILSHSSVYQTMYAHLHTVLVKKGDVVKQGSQIGTVGTTGYSTGPHLHFGVFKNGRAVNPLDFLNHKN
ncbi:MAG: M23 family metallopeptidase, partial [Treponema sp.]|nr:M23 family metallopeptidase [Treponema sp.]